MNTKDMLQIYHKEIPDFLKKYLETPEMKRIQKVDMNCGMKYTSIPFFHKTEWYSRYDHSLGTALITWHFTQNKAMTIASLFHDIATPVFSHVVDFANGDYMRQESTEERTAWILEHSETIMNGLHEDGLSLDEVNNYHMYPVCDNESPNLCADRLEYLIGGSYAYRLSSFEDLCNMYEDIQCGNNEFGIQELVFQEKEKAYYFAKIGLECGKVYIQKEDRYCMERLGRLLNKAIQENILTQDDFYTMEEDVILKLEHSFMKEEWEAFTNIYSVSSSLQKPETECYCISAKKRMINPYVLDKGRITDLFPSFQEELDAFLNRDDSKIYLYETRRTRT